MIVYRNEAKQKKKERQKKLREEREALGTPPPKKTKIDHGTLTKAKGLPYCHNITICCT